MMVKFNVRPLMLVVALCSVGLVQAQPKNAAKQADVSGLIAELDTNHDGCVSHEEWTRGGAPETAYQTVKDPNGCVTVAGMNKVPQPEGLDANGDGKLTLAELKAFDLTMAKAAKPAASAPGKGK
jgi:hypothetical protein